MKALMGKKIDQMIKDKTFTWCHLSSLLKGKEVTIENKQYTLAKVGRDPR